MYICIHTHCICMHPRVLSHTYMHTYMYTHTHMYKHRHVYMHLYARVHRCKYIHTHACGCGAHVCQYIHTYMLTELTVAMGSRFFLHQWSRSTSKSWGIERQDRRFSVREWKTRDTHRKNTQVFCHVHPKTLIEIAMVLSANSGSFPSNSHVSATFSILLRFGEFWNPTNCEKFDADGSLMRRTNPDKSVW